MVFLGLLRRPWCALAAAVALISQAASIERVVIMVGSIAARLAVHFAIVVGHARDAQQAFYHVDGRWHNDTLASKFLRPQVTDAAVSGSD